jgi:predicted MPP superfamily phosphohydrolase
MKRRGLFAGQLSGSRTLAAAALAAAAVAARAIRRTNRPVLTRLSVAIRNLPPAFAGLRVAFLTDTHHGPGVPCGYLAGVVERTNALQPDLILLGGDYVQRRRGWRRLTRARDVDTKSAIDVVGPLRASLGVFAVLGNHDHRTNPALIRQALSTHGIVDLTNTGVWLCRRGARLRIAGVDDLRRGKPDLVAALAGVGADDACLLLSHNPDFVERLSDPRVDLVLSGHTHGGQIVLPWLGAPVTSSRFGQKYRAGLVQGPGARVYVSRGIGTVGLPLRVSCPPEIVLLTLTPATGRVSVLDTL